MRRVPAGQGGLAAPSGAPQDSTSGLRRRNSGCAGGGSRQRTLGLRFFSVAILRGTCHMHAPSVASPGLPVQGGRPRWGAMNPAGGDCSLHSGGFDAHKLMRAAMHALKWPASSQLPTGWQARTYGNLSPVAAAPRSRCTLCESKQEIPVTVPKAMRETCPMSDLKTPVAAPHN